MQPEWKLNGMSNYLQLALSNAPCRPSNIYTAQMIFSLELGSIFGWLRVPLLPIGRLKPEKFLFEERVKKFSSKAVHSSILLMSSNTILQSIDEGLVMEI